MTRAKLKGWENLHPKQQQLYRFLVELKGEDAPTLDDMREELGVSSINTVVHHLGQLEKKGYVRRNGDYGQLEVLLAPVEDIVYLSLYGTAGCSPTGFFNDDNVVDRIPFPARQLRVNADSFLIEARGDSMEPLIYDKDLVLVNRTPATSGDTTLVVHDDEAKLKKFYKERGRVVLQSLNPKYKPMVVEPQNVRPVGVVSGVVRRFREEGLNVRKNRP